VNISINKSTQ